MDRRGARKRISLAPGEKRYEPDERSAGGSAGSSGTIDTAPPRLALQLSRAADALDGGGVVYLFARDGTSVLVALAVLDGDRIGRRTDFAHAASVGGADLCGCGAVHVFAVVAADALCAGGQSLVAFAALLHNKPGRKDAAGGTIQRRAENVVLELFLVCTGALSHRIGSVVHRLVAVEFAVAAVCFGNTASDRSARDDREFHDSHLYGRVRGARSVRVGHPWRRFHGVRQALPSGMVRGDCGFL